MALKLSPLAPNKFKKLNQIPGISVASIHCGFKNNGNDDLVLIKFDKPAKIFGSFTRSTTPGAPIIWNKSIISKHLVSAILINSGNANVFNGKKGEEAVQEIVKFLSVKMSVNKKEIYIASTGIIGELLDPKKIISKIPNLIKKLKNDSSSWFKAANAIRTTDTFPKLFSEQIKISKSNKILINGIAKGSGMIAPNMATMLSFIFTNADVNIKEFKKVFRRLVDKTFNSITVDSDTSTSDMVLFISLQGISKQKFNALEKQKIIEKIETLMMELAQLIVRDGEGASKFISISINGTKNDSIAKKIALSIANSPLFKTAMAGSDSNWGRIIMAIGKEKVKINTEKISIKFGKYFVVKNGVSLINRDTKSINKYLKRKEIELSIKVGDGRGKSKVWTCDLTKEYIKINADYRS